MMRFLWSTFALLLLSTACGEETTSDWLPGEKADEQGCTPHVEDGEWVHSFSHIFTTAQGDAHHGAADVVINAGDTATVTARFAYGGLLKDLEDENISAWIETKSCSWQSLGVARTDDDGTVSFAVDASFATSPGRHDVRLEVHGDGSSVYSSVWVAPAGQKTVVFDIDGTLTEGDSELFKNLLLGAEPTMYDSANDVAWAYADRGYQVIYITGRPVYLDGRSRQWLASQDFPRGPLKLVYDLDETLPFERFVGAFKQRTLEAFKNQQGLDIAFAYGNAATDICAYAGAEIDPKHTFIIGVNAGDACDQGEPTQKVAHYAEHLPQLITLLNESP